jgi:hypothetical protein
MPHMEYPSDLCDALKNDKECRKPDCKASHFYRICELCRKAFYTAGAWLQHVNSIKHKEREAEGGPIFNTKTRKRRLLCPQCQIYVPNIKAHNGSRNHWRSVRFHKLKKLVEEAKKDKCGVVVEGQFNFDVVERKDAEKGVARAGSLRLTSPGINVTLLEVSLGSTKEQHKRNQVYVSFARLSPVV